MIPLNEHKVTSHPISKASIQ